MLSVSSVVKNGVMFVRSAQALLVPLERPLNISVLRLIYSFDDEQVDVRCEEGFVITGADVINHSINNTLW